MLVNHFNKAVASTLVLGALIAAGHAQQIASQSDLAAILGSGESMETFEGMGQLDSSVGQIALQSLNSTTSVDGFGPGLVLAGASYSSPGSLYWDADGYYGLHTRTLGDASGWRGDQTVITYNENVTAFGFDMSPYQGLDESGTVSVYDTNGKLITDSAVNGGFFGWQYAGGIGSVVISANSGYIMIDNHGYGATPAPEPLTLSALGLGVFALARKRRAK